MLHPALDPYPCLGYGEGGLLMHVPAKAQSGSAKLGSQKSACAAAFPAMGMLIDGVDAGWIGVPGMAVTTA